nr:site-specific DNA-methyltransferase [Treponema sp.]
MSCSSTTSKKILPKDDFGYPKATDYILKILQMANCKDNSTVLDFFAGSGTTGHTV